MPIAKRYYSTRKGFSMVELLAVVAIIGIMATIIGLGLSGGNEGVKLGNGQRIAASIFQSARSIAVLRQTRTRVIIYGEQSGTNGTDPRKFLSYVGIVYEDPDNPGTWLAANQGTYLPEGVYFMPNDTVSSLNIIDPTATQTAKNASVAANFEFPVKGGAAENFYYYEFDANGMSENAGDTFVLNAGRVESEGGGSVSVAIENPYAASGFAIRKIGSVTLMFDYDEIEAANGGS